MSTESVQLQSQSIASPEHQAGIQINLSVRSRALPAPPAARADQCCDPGHDQGRGLGNARCSEVDQELWPERHVWFFLRVELPERLAAALVAHQEPAKVAAGRIKPVLDIADQSGRRAPRVGCDPKKG
jgi:hypothetical protein